MNKIPLVSVIISVYNEEKYLDFCLSSITNQTYKNTEVIVVDDGSQDKSREIAKKYQVKIIKQSHQGPGAARNLGASCARGEILVFVDADMRFEKNYIEKLIRPIVGHQAIGTFVKEELVANPKNIWSRCWAANSSLPPDRRLPKDYSETENDFRAILKDYFVKVRGFNVGEGYTDDESLSRKLKIKAVNAPGAVCYHYNPSALDEVFFSARWIGRGKSFKQNLANFLRYCPLNSLRVSIKYLLRGAPLAIIPFKLAYDAGMFVGIFLRTGNTSK